MGLRSPRLLVMLGVLPRGIPFATLIRDVSTTGNSEAGVFDEGAGCLKGIMSRKIERFVAWDIDVSAQRKMEGIAKYFVPAATIRDFLGPNLLSFESP